MGHILKNKKALATVVTTLIILVVAVLLATVVTYYAVNITTNRMQQESLSMSNLHVWYNTTSPGWAEAAFSLVNTGGKDVVLQSITARSQPSAWTNVYYWTTSTATVSTLGVTNATLSATADQGLINGTWVTLKAATGVITLKAGWTLVVYVMHPDSIGQNDVGTPCDVTVFTANAQWTQEVNVQASQ
jgi:hypothetical protein